MYNLLSSGDLAKLEDMTITMESNGTSSQFTLTCISTGGPATNVIWTRDSDIVTQGTKTVLDDRVTAQYTHTLTVTEASSFNGTYSCEISNDKPSSVSETINEAKVIHTGHGNLLYIVFTTKHSYMQLLFIKMFSSTL